MATVAARAPIASRQRERKFYIAAGAVIALVVLSGFARTYFLKSYFGTPALTPLVHLHGLLFTSWVALFITQATLVSRRRTDLHMRLGIAGFLVAVSMIVVGTATAITAARLGHTPGPPPLRFLVVPLGDMVIFSIFIAAGFFYRYKSDVHKRLMVVATAGLMTAAFGRLTIIILGVGTPLFAMGATSLLVIAAATYDAISHRRLHPAFAWAGALLILSYPLRFALAQTDAWMTFARWLTS